MEDLLLGVHVVFKPSFAARAARLFFLIQPIRSLFSGVVGTARAKVQNTARTACFFYFVDFSVVDVVLAKSL